MKVKLKLYIVGNTASSNRALENLNRIFEEELKRRYELKVIDVLKEPGLANADKILAVPALVREAPPPLAVVIGDFSDKTEVLMGLELGPGEGDDERA